MVKLHTTMGDITLELDSEKAPKTVENFLQYVKDGFFDGTIFHRVIDGFMIQGGGFEPDMTQKATRGMVENEAANGLKNDAYTVAMARTPRITGAFHGAMPTTTPTGWRIAMARQPGLSEGITSPAIWVVMAAASRIIPAASMTLKRAQPSVAPISPIIASTNCGARRSRASAALVRTARRAFGPSAAQAGSACAARSATAAGTAAPRSG